MLAQRYAEEVQAEPSDLRGNLEVYPYRLDEVSWTDGYVTEWSKKKKKGENKKKNKKKRKKG